MNILVVDDDVGFREALALFLKHEGWNVFRSEDGEDALRKMAKLKIDLLISDLYMPVMDGFKLHETIRGMQAYERLPFIFVSGCHNPQTIHLIKDPTIEAFHSKERPAEELLECVYYLMACSKNPAKAPQQASDLPLRAGLPVTRA